MNLLQAHVDETLTRFRLLGPRRDGPARAEPGAQGEVPGRRDEFQADTSNAANDRGSAWKEPSR